MNHGDSAEPRQPEAADAETLAEGLLAQVELLWEVELDDTPMAVDFDPLPER